MSTARFVNIKLDGEEVRDHPEQDGGWIQIGRLIEIAGVHYVHIGKKHYRIFRDARIKNGKIIKGTLPGWYLAIELEKNDNH